MIEMHTFKCDPCYGFRIKMRTERPIHTRDQSFLELLKEVSEWTIVSANRLYMLYQFAQYANAKEGDVAEVGVYKGGTARLFARVCSGKTVHLFDTFAGMPPSYTDIDLHLEGDFADTSLAAVQALLSDLSNVAFHPGVFPLTSTAVADRQFALVYADADLYKSTLDCLTFFYPRVVPGGIMLFDDWEWRGCPGVKQALTEFLRDRPEVPIVTTHFQCVLIKV